MKRGRNDLTGGSGDVSPQLLTATVTMSAANTLTEVSIPTPVTRIATRKGRAMVIECLKIFMDLGVKDNNYAAGGESSVITAILAVTTTIGLPNASSLILALINKEYRGAFTAAGSYSSVQVEPIVVDLTDGAGHGVLVGTDQIFLGVTTTNFAAASTGTMRLLYRFKEVSVEEYIGIVQSQL